MAGSDQGLGLMAQPTNQYALRRRSLAADHVAQRRFNLWKVEAETQLL